jgi:hypothetical protein
VRSRLPRDLYLVLAVVFVGLRLLSIEPWDDSVDAYAYWSTRDGSFYDGALADAGAGRIGAYLYSPVFAQLLAPLVQLPWPVFAAGWTALNLAVLWWLAGRAALAVLLLPPVAFEVISGNVHLLYAAAIVAGFRLGGAWALMLLTKVTPGIGLIWFLVRREWRPLAAAVGVTAALISVSWLLDRGAWTAWADLLTRQLAAPLQTTGWYLPVALLPRLGLAGIVVAYGAWTDRAWTVPIGVTLALPILWLNGLSVLVACLPLARERRRAQVSDG